MILALYNVSNIRLVHILHQTLSRPLFKSTSILKRVYLHEPAQKLCSEHLWQHSKRSCRVKVVV